MKVRMKVKLTGTRDGVQWPAVGEVKDLPDHEGAKLCQQGWAEPVVEDKTERAVPRKRAETRKG